MVCLTTGFFLALLSPSPELSGEPIRGGWQMAIAAAFGHPLFQALHTLHEPRNQFVLWCHTRYFTRLSTLL
jgi:hypothetical protein